MSGERDITIQLQRASLDNQEKIRARIDNYVSTAKQYIRAINQSANSADVTEYANHLLQNSLQAFHYVTLLSKQKEFKNLSGFLIALQIKSNNQVKENIAVIYQKNPEAIIHWLKDQELNKETIKEIEALAHVFISYLNNKMKDAFDHLEASERIDHSPVIELGKTAMIAPNPQASLATLKLNALQKEIIMQHEVYKILAQKGSRPYAIEYLNSIHANNMSLENEPISFFNFLINLITAKKNWLDDERTKSVIQNTLPIIAEAFMAKNNINHKTKYFADFLKNCEKAEIFLSNTFSFEMAEKLYGENHEALFSLAFNKMTNAISAIDLNQKAKESANSAMYFLMNSRHDDSISFKESLETLRENFSKNQFTQLFFDALNRKNAFDLTALYACCDKNGNSWMYKELDTQFKSAAEKIDGETFAWRHEDVKNYMVSGTKTLSLAVHLIEALEKKNIVADTIKKAEAQPLKDPSRKKLIERFNNFKRHVLTTGTTTLFKKHPKSAEKENPTSENKPSFRKR